MNYFTEEDISVVQKYLSNRLPQAERTAFEQRLQADPKLQEELEWYQAMFCALEESEDQRLKSLLQAASAEEEKATPQRRLPSRSKWAIAAGFLLLLSVAAFLWIWNTGQSKDTLFATSNFTADVISADLIKTRSAAIENPDTQSISQISVQDALLMDQLYNQGKYRQALAILDTLPPSPSILFYRANCLMALNRNEEAIPILQEVETYTDEIYSNFAQWYLALAYYRINNEAQARSYAQKTIDNQGIEDVNREKARILLEELNRD